MFVKPRAHRAAYQKLIPFVRPPAYPAAHQKQCIMQTEFYHLERGAMPPRFNKNLSESTCYLKAHRTGVAKRIEVLPQSESECGRKFSFYVPRHLRPSNRYFFFDLFRFFRIFFNFGSSSGSIMYFRQRGLPQ